MQAMQVQSRKNVKTCNPGVVNKVAALTFKKKYFGEKFCKAFYFRKFYSIKNAHRQLMEMHFRTRCKYVYNF